MKKIHTAIIAIIILSFIIAIYVYPTFPDEVASHWNTKGEVDGYMSKFWGIFLMPIVSIAMFLMLVFIPKLDPLKKNMKKFRAYFDGFILFMILSFFYVYILTILFNLGITFNMTYAVLPAISILFYLMGILLKNCKRNWFIGIRNPWTLSSDRVWDKTHKLGSIMFKIIALLLLVKLFFPDKGFTLFIIPLFVMIIWLYIYSYLEFKKEKKK